MLNTETITAIKDAAQSMSLWELVAVILALAYLILAMKEKNSCWYAAFISTAIYLFLFWDVSLLMESALQVFYLVMAVFGYGLAQKTHAALPYLDSFTTWGAVITTYMVTRKVLENWIYWIVIDGASVYLYIDRGLYLTALLFMLYVVLVVIGFYQWNTLYKQERHDHAAG
jgi:nicotinamide mononucleotide transporter